MSKNVIRAFVLLGFGALVKISCSCGPERADGDAPMEPGLRQSSYPGTKGQGLPRPLVPAASFYPQTLLTLLL